MDNLMLFQSALLLFSYLGACVAYSSGPPLSQCETMTPFHRNQVTNAPYPAQEEETNPYSIRVSNSSYSPGDTLNVTISGNATYQFKGFILQARSDSSNVPVGVFTGSLPSHTQFMQCPSGEPQNTVGHNHGSTKISWKSIDFVWRAPSHNVGNVTFRATVVREFQTFWKGISSDTITGLSAQNISTLPTLVSSFPPSQSITTLPTLVSSSQVPVTGCGSTKSCFFVPKGCTGFTDCDYFVTYRAVQGDNIVFELGTKSAQWVSIGFNSQNEMPNGDMLVCAVVNGQVAVDHYYANNGKSDPTKTDPRPDAISLETGTSSGGGLSCRFNRKIDPKVSNMVDLNKNWYLLYAKGPMRSSVIGFHSYYAVSSRRVNVNTVGILEAGDATKVLIKVHGILMILSWMGCATIAIFMARYMRPAWPETKLFDKKLWFVFHRSLMVTCILLTAISFIVIFVHVRGWSQGDASKHAIIGVIVTVLSFVQPVMAFFRPHPGEPKRSLFNWAHRCVGLSAWILSVVNMFLGLLLPHLSLKNNGLYIMIAFCVSVGVVLIVLELYMCCASTSETAGYTVSDSKAQEMQMSHPDVKRTSEISKQNLIVRQIFLGLLVFAAVALMIAVFVFIGKA